MKKIGNFIPSVVAATICISSVPSGETFSQATPDTYFALPDSS